MLYFPDGYRLNDTMYFVPAHTGTKSHQYTMSEVQPASLLVTEATEACLVLNGPKYKNYPYDASKLQIRVNCAFPDGYRNGTMYFVPAHTGTKRH